MYILSSCDFTDRDKRGRQGFVSILGGFFEIYWIFDRSRRRLIHHHTLLHALCPFSLQLFTSLLLCHSEFGWAVLASRPVLSRSLSFLLGSSSAAACGWLATYFPTITKSHHNWDLFGSVYWGHVWWWAGCDKSLYTHTHICSLLNSNAILTSSW